MKNLLESPLFLFFLSLLIYIIVTQLYRKVKFPLLSPLLISGLVLMFLLEIGWIDINIYKESSGLQRQLVPFLTLGFVLPMYQCRHIIRKRIISILLGGFLGLLVSIITVVVPAKLLGLPQLLNRSLLLKSVTASLALEIITLLKGSEILTTLSIVVTGIVGSIVAPFIFRVFHITDPIAKGFSLGSAAHLVGAARAEEYGEIEAGAAGAAIGVFGSMTVLFLLFWTHT